MFDLYWALIKLDIDIDKLIHCYRAYMDFSVGKSPSGKMFLANIEEKMKDKEFNNDIHVILRPGIEYNNDEAYEFVKTKLLEKI